MPIVLCSMSMKAKSNPQAASTRPVSTVRACLSPIPSASWPAARRSLTLFGMAAGTRIFRASVAVRRIDTVESADQPGPHEIASAAAWARGVLHHRVRRVDDVLADRNQLGAARLGP